MTLATFTDDAVDSAIALAVAAVDAHPAAVRELADAIMGDADRHALERAAKLLVHRADEIEAERGITLGVRGARLLAAELFRRVAAAHASAEAESFARSDTDGFLSQWASGLGAQEARAKAALAEAGGVHRFAGLFHADTGQRVRAKATDGQYGRAWRCVDADGFTVGWVNEPDSVGVPYGEDNFTRPGPRSKMARLGLYVEWESAPARVGLNGSGTGLAGAASVYVTRWRTDDGYPADAVPLGDLLPEGHPNRGEYLHRL